MAKNKKNIKFLLLASYANNLGWGVYAPLYAIFVLKLGGTSFDVSFLWSIYALLTGLLMMLFGRLENSKKYNPALMLVIGYGLFVIIAIGFLYVHTVHQFYALQILLAFAMGIMTPAARASYARAQKKGKEAGQWGLFDGENYILIAIASFSGGILYKFGGFHSLFIAMLAIQLLATYLAIINLRSNMSKINL
ncbi:MAG: MFS transporter [Candidatus Saccharimonadales bacterium]